MHDGENGALLSSVEGLTKAFEDKGANPQHYNKKLIELAVEWPTLYFAIVRVIEDGKRI